jgi:hypothetical protein
MSPVKWPPPPEVEPPPAIKKEALRWKRGASFLRPPNYRQISLHSCAVARRTLIWIANRGGVAYGGGG